MTPPETRESVQRNVVAMLKEEFNDSDLGRFQIVDDGYDGSFDGDVIIVGFAGDEFSPDERRWTGQLGVVVYLQEDFGRFPQVFAAMSKVFSQDATLGGVVMGIYYDGWLPEEAQFENGGLAQTTTWIVWDDVLGNVV